MSNTNIKNWILVLALAAAAPTAVYAAPAGSNPPAAAPEEGRCTGHVYDADGEDVIGATVIVDGTKNATATDLDGNFSLNNVRPGAKITVTYVGMKAWHGTWNGQPLDIQLSTDSSVLDEVVVMGYGVEQKRAKVTNSIAKVGEKTLTIGTNANPAQALVGAVSGVKVGVTSGAPGSTPNITIRGGSNYSTSDNGVALNSSYNAPLVVVDGQVRGSLADINPNDIESMEILKDAGATALYGARAGNGVILVTTKQGKQGTGKVTANVKWGLGYYNNGYETVEDDEYLMRYRTACFNTQHMLPGGQYAANYNSMLYSNNQPCGIGRTEWANNMTYNILQKNDKTAYLLDKGWSEMLDPVSDNYILFWNQDIMKLNTNQPSLTQDYNISFSGGNDRGNYYASIGYYNAEGTIKHTSYKRYNFAFTGEYKLTSWLKSNSIFNFTRSEDRTQPFGMRNSYNDIIGYMLNRGFMYKFVRYYDEEGNNLVGTGANQPTTNVNTFDGLEDYRPQNDKFQMTQALTVDIIDNLKLKGTMSWLYNESYSQYQYYAFPTNNTGAANMEGNSGVNRTYNHGASFSRYFDQTYNLVASWNKTFAEAHTISAMAGMEYYRRHYSYLAASSYGAPTPFYDLSLGTQDSKGTGGYNLDEALLSYFGRVEYDYMDKYLLAATFREDGYSRLINKRWGFFPGVSAGWVFSKEKFWEDNESLKWFNYGKLRGSFGMNATINSSYLGYYTLQGAYGSSDNSGSFNYDGNTGYRLTTLPNPDLSWEKTRTAEVGLTMGFLQNRLNLDLTYYNRTTIDKYGNKTLPPTTGFSAIVANNGSYRNEGVEIDLNATVLRMRDFQWTLGANLTFNHNKIVKLPVSGLDNNRVSGTGTEVYDGNKKDEDGNYVTKFVGGFQEGQSPFQVVGYGVKGMARSQADIDALDGYVDTGGSYGVAVYATEKGRQYLLSKGYTDRQMVQLMPGDLIFEDINGDGMVDSFDRKVIGERDVKWSGGLNTTLSWKGLSLYARFDYGFGFQVYDSNMAFWLGEGQGSMSFPTQIRDTWTVDNPNGKYPRVVWASQYGTDNYIRTSEFFKQNGNYIACRELSLSYQVPEKICQKFRCQGLSVSVTGQNLGYIKSCTIPLPDYVSYWNGNTAGWGGTYNLPRTVIFGLNVSF